MGMYNEAVILSQLHQKLAVHLEQISELFKNPKITLVVRSPDLPDGDVVLTDDELDKAIAAIERLKGRDSGSSGRTVRSTKPDT